MAYFLPRASLNSFRDLNNTRTFCCKLLKVLIQFVECLMFDSAIVCRSVEYVKVAFSSLEWLFIEEYYPLNLFFRDVFPDLSDKLNNSFSARNYR